MVCRLENAYFEHLRRLFSMESANEPNGELDEHGSEYEEGGQGADAASALRKEPAAEGRGGESSRRQDSPELEESQVVFGVVSGKTMYETRARAVAQTWLYRHSAADVASGTDYPPLRLTHTYIYGDEGHELRDLHELGGKHGRAKAGATRTILPVPVPLTAEHAFLSKLTLHDDFFSSVPKFVLALCDMHRKHPGAKVCSCPSHVASACEWLQPRLLGTAGGPCGPWMSSPSDLSDKTPIEGRLQQLLRARGSALTCSMQWYYVAGCDTYLLPANLLRAIQGLDHQRRIVVGGHAGMHFDTLFLSGGSGLVFSQVQSRCDGSWQARPPVSQNTRSTPHDLGVPSCKRTRSRSIDLKQGRMMAGLPVGAGSARPEAAARLDGGDRPSPTVYSVCGYLLRPCVKIPPGRHDPTPVVLRLLAPILPVAFRCFL